MTALAVHEAAFERWLLDSAAQQTEATDAADDDARARVVAHVRSVLAAVRDAVASAADRSGLADPATWTPDQLADVLEDLARQDVAEALFLFLGFLEGTGRWTGTAEDLAACLRLTAAELDPEGEIAELVDTLTTAVQVDATAEDAALAALPLTADLRVALSWVRRRDSDTGTGPDPDPGPGPGPGDGNPDGDGGDGEGGGGELVVAVAQGDDLAVRHLWNAVRAAQLVGADGRSLTLTDAGRALLAEPPDGRQVRRAVGTWLLLLLRVPQFAATAPVDAQVLAATVGLVLLRGVGARPVDAAALGQALATAAPQAPDGGHAAADEAVHRVLGRLVRAGLLDVVDDAFVVPEQLASVVVWAVRTASA